MACLESAVNDALCRKEAYVGDGDDSNSLKIETLNADREQFHFMYSIQFSTSNHVTFP